MIRNICRINYRENSSHYIDDFSGVDRNTQLNAFQNQFIYEFIIVIAANVRSEYPELSTTLTECLYYMLRGIDVSYLFGIEEKISEADAAVANSNRRDLKSLLMKEQHQADTSRKSTSRWKNNRTGAFYSVFSGGNEVFTLTTEATGGSVHDSTLAELTSNKRKSRQKQGPIREGGRTEIMLENRADLFVNLEPLHVKTFARL